jgi:hypothetical protein
MAELSKPSESLEGTNDVYTQGFFELIDVSLQDERRC